MDSEAPRRGRARLMHPPVVRQFDCLTRVFAGRHHRSFYHYQIGRRRQDRPAVNSG